jgi:hypothetical protein
VWRIEKFCVVPWPQAKYGKFHTGDSYVVLHSYKKPGQDKLFHDLHIWIGKESSQVRGLQAKQHLCSDFLSFCLTRCSDC